MSDTDEVTIVDPEVPEQNRPTSPSTPPPLTADEVSIVEPSGENFDESEYK